MSLPEQSPATGPRVVDNATKAGAIRTIAAVIGGASTLVLGRVTGSTTVGATGLASSWGAMAAGLAGAGLAPTLIRFGASMDVVGPRLRRLSVIGAAIAAGLAVLGLVTFDREGTSRLTMVLAAVVGACTVIGGVSGARLVLAGRLIRQAIVSLAAAVAAGLSAVAAHALSADHLTTAAVFSLTGTSVLTVGLSLNNSWEQRRRLVAEDQTNTGTTVVALSDNPTNPEAASTTTRTEAGGTEAAGTDTTVSAAEVQTFLKRSWVTNLVQMAVYRADSLILGAVAVSAELGRYLLMLKAIEALAMIVQARSSMVIGDTVFQDQARAVASTVSNGRLAIKTSLALGVIGSIGFGTLAPVLLGKTFVADRWWIAVLAVPSLLLTASSIYSSYFAARGILGVGLRASTVGLVVTLPLYLLLVPPYGLRGACVASAVVYLSQAGYVYWSFRSHVRALALG